MAETETVVRSCSLCGVPPSSPIGRDWGTLLPDGLALSEWPILAKLLLKVWPANGAIWSAGASR